MSDRYYLKADHQTEWDEVSREQFIAAEQAAGFHSKFGLNHPATGGFSGSGMCGRVEYITKEQPMIGKSKTEFDMRLGEFMERFDHKEQPMSDALPERKSFHIGSEHCNECFGYPHMPWCSAYEETIPCQRCKGIATTTVNTRHFGIEKLCEPCAVNVRRDGQEVMTEHKPAARGGGGESKRYLLAEQLRFHRLFVAVKALRQRHRTEAKKSNFKDCSCDDCLLLEPIVTAIEHEQKDGPQ